MNHELLTMNFFARVLSRVFDPFVMLGILFILLFSHTTIFFPAFLLMVLFPFLLFFLAWKTKFIANWDVTDRRERPKILWILVAIEIFASVLLHTDRGIFVIVAIAGFTVMTHFWKMSGHAMAASLMTGYIVARFGWAWWPVLLIVPLVGWARVIRRDHTIWQVIVGALYSWGFLLLYETWYRIF